jgi:hypothetical protein
MKKDLVWMIILSLFPYSYFLLVLFIVALPPLNILIEYTQELWQIFPKGLEILLIYIYIILKWEEIFRESSGYTVFTNKQDDIGYR